MFTPEGPDNLSGLASPFELRQDDKGRVIRLNTATGEIAVIRDGKLFQNVMPVDAVTFVSRYDVWPDGQRFLVRVPAEGGETSPITVIVNWAAG